MQYETLSGLLGRSRTLAPRHLSLAFKFPLFVLALLLAVIWGLALFADFSLKQHLERLLAAHQLSAVSVIAESLDQEIRLRVQLIDDLAQVAGKRNLYGLPEQLNAFLQDHPAIATLFNGGLLALDANGVVLADAPAVPGRVGRNLARDDLIATLARDKAAVNVPLAGTLSGHRSMVIAAPVVAASGRAAGVLVGITDLEATSFVSRITGTYGGEHGGVLLIDPRSGRFVAATDPTRILQPIPAPGVNRIHDRHMAGHGDAGIAVSSRGVEELSSSRRVPATGWLTVGVLLPTAEAFAPVRAIQNTILGAALFLSVAVPLLAVGVTRRWLKPLREATAALGEMTGGERALEPLPVRTHDEIGRLIASFNRLQARICANERLLREHHARLQTALDAARMRFFEWSATAEEPVSADLLALTHREDRERVEGIIGQAGAARGRFLAEFRSPDPDGGAAWFMVRGQAFEENAGTDVIAIVWDITEFKSAELALYENEERFEAIVDSLNDAVFFQDGQSGEILCANASASEMFGYSRGAFRRLSFGALCAEDKPTQHAALSRLARAFEQGEATVLRVPRPGCRRSPVLGRGECPRRPDRRRAAFGGGGARYRRPQDGRTVPAGKRKTLSHAAGFVAGRYFRASRRRHDDGQPLGAAPVRRRKRRTVAGFAVDGADSPG